MNTLISPSPLGIIKATIQKDFQIAKRYIPNFIGRFIQLIIRVVFFLLVAMSMSYEGSMNNSVLLQDQGRIIFYISAMLLLVIKDPALFSPLHAISDDLYNGTLEYLYITPGSRYAYYIGTVLHSLIFSLIIFIPFLLFLYFYAALSIANLFLIVAVCIMVVFSLSALGIIFSLSALLWKQVATLVQFFAMILEFLGGAYLPVQDFPFAIKIISSILPFTWGYDLIRYYAFDGNWNTILPVWQEWLILFSFAILFTILSRILLNTAGNKVKKTGLSIRLFYHK